MAHSPWHKNYSVVKVFLNAISFPLCSDIDSLWNRYCVSKDSSVIFVILLLSSEMNSKASQFQDFPVSIAIGTKWCVVARVFYFAVLLVAALFAAASALLAVSPM